MLDHNSRHLRCNRWQWSFMIQSRKLFFPFCLRTPLFPCWRQDISGCTFAPQLFLFNHKRSISHTGYTQYMPIWNNFNFPGVKKCICFEHWKQYGLVYHHQLYNLGTIFSLYCRAVPLVKYIFQYNFAMHYSLRLVWIPYFFF